MGYYNNLSQTNYGEIFKHHPEEHYPYSLFIGMLDFPFTQLYHIGKKEIKNSALGNSIKKEKW
jgi:hypothetical protein